MTDWLDCLINPNSVVRSGRQSPKNRTVHYPLALLLGGHFFEYHRLSDKENLPSLAGDKSVDGDAVTRVLTAVTGYLGGRNPDLDTLKQVARDHDEPIDFRVFVGAVAAVVLSDDGAHGEAITLMQELAGTSVSRHFHEGAVIRLHLGLRQAEIGELQSAIEASHSVIDILQASRARVASTVRAVAHRNIWLFERWLGDVRSKARPPRVRPEPLVELTEFEAEGTSKYLEDRFLSRLTDARTRQFSWMAEDRVDSRLSAALLRAECLADCQSTRRFRRLLGRYRALRTAGGILSQVDSTLHLLRRAGDAEGTKLFAGSIRRSGPLEPFTRVVESVAEGPWPAFEVAPALHILRSGAALLSRVPASMAARRLRLGFNDLRRSPSARHEHEIIGTISAIVHDSPIDPDEHDRTLEWFLTLTTLEDPLVLQELARAVESMPWGNVSSDVAERWLAYGLENITAGGDRSLVARSTLVSLKEQYGEEVFDALLTAFESTPSLFIGGALVLTQAPLAGEVVDSLGGLVIQLLERKREDAAKHKHTVGSGYDPAAVLSHLNLEAGLNKWTQLLDFLLDANVPVSEKIPTLEILSSAGTKLPKDMRSRLAAGWASLKGPTDPILSRPEDWISVQLKFASQLGAGAKATTLADAVSAANSPDPSVRLVAAQSLPLLPDVLGNEMVAALLLALSQDNDISVRAQSAYAVALSDLDVDRPLLEVLDKRLASNLDEDGVDVPIASLMGIRDGMKAGKAIKTAAVDQIRRLETSHPAANIRRLARTIEDARRGGVDTRGQP